MGDLLITAELFSEAEKGVLATGNNVGVGAEGCGDLRKRETFDGN